jgi:hypothetical protein
MKHLVKLFVAYTGVASFSFSRGSMFCQTILKTTSASSEKLEAASKAVLGEAEAMPNTGLKSSNHHTKTFYNKN